MVRSPPLRAKNFLVFLSLNKSFNRLFMNLFRKILFCLFFYLCISPVFSQEVSLRGGLNISQMASYVNGRSLYEHPPLKLGFHLGPCFNIPINKTLSFETGIFCSTKGSRDKQTGVDGNFALARLNLAYLETPMALKVKIFSRDLALYGFGGGYFATALLGRLYGEIEGEDSFRKQITWERGTEYSLKRFDYGAKMGFEVQKNKFRLGISYSFGFANLSYTTNTTGYNRVFDLYLGYQLFNKN